MYRRIHNVIIPSKNGTIQIDHIIISPYGVFIIETKNIKGWIFGSSNHPRWTQVLFGKKYSFQNPLRQTFRQKKGLSAYLGLSETFIHDIIYFPGNCRFKTILPSNVLNSGLSRYIRHHNDEVLSDIEISLIIKRISEAKFDDQLTIRNHIKNLNERYASNIICPKCGAKLVERIPKRAFNSDTKFLGCENYPKCKFTKSVST